MEKISMRLIIFLIVSFFAGVIVQHYFDWQGIALYVFAYLMGVYGKHISK